MASSSTDCPGPWRPLPDAQLFRLVLEDLARFRPRCRVPWAELLRKVVSLDVLSGPRCVGRMQLLAFIVENKRLSAVLAAIQADQTLRDQARLASRKVSLREKDRLRAARARAGIPDADRQPRCANCPRSPRQSPPFLLSDSNGGVNGLPPAGDDSEGEPMSLPFSILFWAAVGNAPRVRHDLSLGELVTEHLAWERRSGRPVLEEEPEEQAWTARDATTGEPLTEGDVPSGVALPSPPSQEERLESLRQAAIELHGLWQSDVLNTVPSQFLLGLCGVADRASWLLEDLEPERSARFAALRDLLMGHASGRRLDDEALHRTAVALETDLADFLDDLARLLNQ